MKLPDDLIEANRSGVAYHQQTGVKARKSLDPVHESVPLACAWQDD